MNLNKLSNKLFNIFARIFYMKLNKVENYKGYQLHIKNKLHIHLNALEIKKKFKVKLMKKAK